MRNAIRYSIITLIFISSFSCVAGPASSEMNNKQPSSSAQEDNPLSPSESGLDSNEKSENSNSLFDGLLSKKNPEYLKIIDYDKEQALFFTIDDGKLHQTINSTYPPKRFNGNPSSSGLEIWENWNLETGNVNKLIHEIPYENNMIEQPNYHINGIYLDNKYLAFITHESEEFNIADLSAREVASFGLDKEKSDGFPFHLDCEETTGICVIGTTSGKVYVFDYKNKREIDSYSMDNLLISQVMAIIPNSSYAIIQVDYNYFMILDYKTKTIHEMEEDWPHGNYRTYPINDGSKALFYETYGGGFPGYAALIDISNRSTLYEYNCPSGEYAMDLQSADISSDGQYVALGCEDHKGNYDPKDDSGIGIVFHSSNPDEILYRIGPIGLGFKESGSNYSWSNIANVEFYP